MRLHYIHPTYNWSSFFFGYKMCMVKRHSLCKLLSASHYISRERSGEDHYIKLKVIKSLVLQDFSYTCQKTSYMKYLTRTKIKLKMIEIIHSNNKIK